MLARRHVLPTPGPRRLLRGAGELAGEDEGVLERLLAATDASPEATPEFTADGRRIPREASHLKPAAVLRIARAAPPPRPALGVPHRRSLTPSPVLALLRFARRSLPGGRPAAAVACSTLPSRPTSRARR